MAQTKHPFSTTGHRAFNMTTRVSVDPEWKKEAINQTNQTCSLLLLLLTHKKRVIVDSSDMCDIQRGLADQYSKLFF